MRRDALERLRAAHAARRPAGLLTCLDDGRQWLWEDGAWIDPPPAVSELDARLREALRNDRSCELDDATGRFFLKVFAPPVRLAVVGAAHIAQPLASMAAQAGYHVILIDPREAWATAERFPSVEIDRRWPDAALQALGPDARTAVVTLSHDPKLDDPALQAALASDAFYIGALGSRRTHARRLDRLRAAGLDEASLGRIHGPVGLAIGAVSPAEIAVSILAQITRVRRTIPADSERNV